MKRSVVVLRGDASEETQITNRSDLANISDILNVGLLEGEYGPSFLEISFVADMVSLIWLYYVASE